MTQGDENMQTVENIRYKVQIVAANEASFGLLATGQKIAVALIIGGYDVTHCSGTMLEGVYRLGHGWPLAVRGREGRANSNAPAEVLKAQMRRCSAPPRSVGVASIPLRMIRVISEAVILFKYSDRSMLGRRVEWTRTPASGTGPLEPWRPTRDGFQATAKHERPMKITLDTGEQFDLAITDGDVQLITQFLMMTALNEACSHGPLDIQILLAMLLEDVALMMSRPGSWEGSNMQQVMMSHGYRT
jgi:hypothetical protein